ncbi:MAG: TonB-dependent receptor [Cytophagales bacterium]|nr:TonB-dependent receptor [Cytophagales bacterium]
MSIYIHLRSFILSSLLLTTSILSAQENDTTSISGDDFFEISLEELMNIKVEVTGENQLSLRETPGIITVITEKEIQKSGARDLVDLLRTVPGLDFVGDIENTVGLGIRGNVSMEGKILVLVDGLEMNETGYGTVVFGNRFMTENIKKIEIIRGPGSAVYGGLAELAVINIITKDTEGAYASTTGGLSNSALSRANAQVGYGTKIGEVKINFSGSYSETNRSNETIDYATNYIDDENGAPISQNYADSSVIRNVDLNLGINYKGLSIRGIYQDHSVQYNYDSGDWVKFGGTYLGAKYDWKINEKLKITPLVTWKHVLPWTYSGNLSGDSHYYTNRNFRSTQKITALYKIHDDITITLGGESYQDQAVFPDDSLVFSNGESSISYYNIGAFGEVAWANRIANFTLGARYDHHNQFGGAFVPRFAITKAFDKLHFKGLVSRAFKAPVINNFELNPNIKPELTTVAELEIGYKLGDNWALIANAFYTDIEDPILYIYDGETFEEDYQNLTRASTIGTELSIRTHQSWGNINANYSFYYNNNTEAAGYLNELDETLLNAFPAHKISITSQINIGEKFTISPTLIYNSKKVGYFYQDEYWENYAAYEYDPTLIANLVLFYQVTKGLNISAGVYDILNQRFVAVNAYDAGYYGTPFMGREFTLKAMYKF